MRRLVRWLIRIVGTLVVLGIILLLAKDALLKEYVQYRLRRETGGDVSIGRLEVSLLKPTLLMENFHLYNPPELGGSPFLVIPEVRLEYDPVAARRQELHFTSAVLNLAELHVVSGPGQKSMLERLQERAGRTKDEKTRINFTGIDTLTLTLGRIRETNLKGGPVADFNLGITNRVLKNVRTEADLVALLIDASLRRLLSSPAPPAK